MGGGGRTSGGSSGRPGGVGNVGQTNSAPAKTSYGGTGQVGGMNVGNATTADYGTAASYGLSPGQYQSAVTGLRNKIEDARDMNEHGFSGMLNSMGKYALGFGGYYEGDPSQNQMLASQGWSNAIADAKRGVSHPVDSSADRMIDPFQVGANVLGAFVPGAGVLYGAGTTAFGHPSFGQIAMDPSAPQANQIGGAPGYGSVSPSGALLGQYANAPSSPNQSPHPGQSGTQQLTNLAQLNSNVSGNPSAPQAVGTPQTAVQSAPNYQQIMASIRGVTPNYGVSLPQYQYRGRATV